MEIKIKFSQEKFIVTGLAWENTGLDGFCFSWVNAAVSEVGWHFTPPNRPCEVRICP